MQLKRMCKVTVLPCILTKMQVLSDRVFVEKNYLFIYYLHVLLLCLFHFVKCLLVFFLYCCCHTYVPIICSIKFLTKFFWQNVIHNI